jgi:hypothetical protein
VSDLKQKPFDIPKRLVWEAYRKVAANKGAAGVDGQSIAEFEEDLKGNLYKLWNRLSSGTYFPPPVRGVEIPKKAGGTRTLGVPYYGRFNRSRLYRLLQRINAYIMRWARNKYRRLGSFKKAKRWWTGLVDREPGLFAHWAWISTF